jgi:hypothetical protein
MRRHLSPRFPWPSERRGSFPEGPRRYHLVGTEQMLRVCRVCIKWSVMLMWAASMTSLIAILCSDAFGAEQK